MEHNTENQQFEEEKKAEGYVPRPAWQVWGARIAAVLFALIILFQIVSIARGGL